MKDKALNLRVIELVIIIVIWMAVFSIPFFSQRISNAEDWGKVTAEWIRMFSFLIIFVVNTFILVPRLLFRKKYLMYGGLTFLLILVVIGVSISLGYILPQQEPLVMPPMDLGPGMPPMELSPNMPPPMGYRPAVQVAQRSIVMILVDNFIISMLVVGAGISIKMVSQWLNEESRRKEIEKEQLKTELAFLRHQLSPHFFMNTLNNIHALIDINAEDAKNTIIQLSTMMRYLLYDTAQGQTTLKKEIAFIESYITLMKLRFSDNVNVRLDVSSKIRDIEIPPMLLISFLENAFKHGVRYQASSFVSVKLEQTEKALNFTILNSKHKKDSNLEKSHSGIGLTNIKKSLELLFRNNYILDIHETEQEYKVQLTIPVV